MAERLIYEIRQGFKIAVISDLTQKELEGAPVEVKKIYESLPSETVKCVSLTGEAEKLAEYYLGERVVGPKHLADAQHIAIAAVARVDILASWNFKHIVNLERIHAFNAVNLKMGYPILEIRSPREVLSGKEI